MYQSCSRCGLLHPQGSPCFSLNLSPEAAPDTLQPGTLLAGRYRIVRTIHRGGMSVVYLAEDRVQNQQVALKELRLPHGANAQESQEAEAWFARESYLLSNLRHPLIPAFYSVFREDDRSYIAQEFVHGENLAEVVARRGPQNPRTVADWGQAICELLTYLHQRTEPVVFRDLKPSNILLRRDGRLAVVDFGIARPYLPGQVGTVIGSPGYAPPEQYQGMASPESDVYALGATLHHLLTGYDPEQGAPFSFPDPRSLNPLISSELAAVVMRAVRVIPEERFPTAGAMGSALREATMQRSDPGAWVPYPARPRSGQPWMQAVLPFAGALLMISILGLWIASSVQQPTQPQPWGPGSIGYDTGGYQLVITTPPDPGAGQPSFPPQAGVQSQSDVSGSTSQPWHGTWVGAGGQDGRHHGWHGR